VTVAGNLSLSTELAASVMSPLLITGEQAQNSVPGTRRLRQDGFQAELAVLLEAAAGLWTECCPGIGVDADAVDPSKRQQDPEASNEEEVAPVVVAAVGVSVPLPLVIRIATELAALPGASKPEVDETVSSDGGHANVDIGRAERLTVLPLVPQQPREALQHAAEMVRVTGGDDKVDLHPISLPSASHETKPGGKLAFAARITPSAPVSVPKSQVETEPSKQEAQRPPDIAHKIEQSPEQPATSVQKGSQRAESDVRTRAAERESPFPLQSATSIRHSPTPAPSHSPAVERSSMPGEPPAARADIYPQPEPLVRPTSAVHQLSLRMGSGRESNVDVHLVERRGNVHVSVRTPDNALAGRLRDQIGDLVTHMDRRGYQTDTWLPGDSRTQSPTSLKEPANASCTEGHSQPGGDHSSGGQGGEQRHQQQSPEWFKELEQTFGSRKETGREEITWDRLLRQRA
jgi:hypothetical protein